MVEGLCHVMPLTGLKSPNIGREEEESCHKIALALACFSAGRTKHLRMAYAII
jgi:hypothetical protein